MSGSAVEVDFKWKSKKGDCWQKVNEGTTLTIFQSQIWKILDKVCLWKLQEENVAQEVFWEAYRKSSCTSI